MGRTVEVSDVWLKRIIGQVQGLGYGTVQITVHDGQIVQIDRTERSRFDVLKSREGSQKKK
ncbi:YezD family protein [Paenibacillus paeoniae]|uniref:DUF2292 domain-containing protein n=1 Tax=Paenibacillus paeoniae TaxID=2292705 RepID=A0A371PGM2_9BACL|nr:YezD family protein [Paenibacillus paeoniae]REK74698.1 DUF2292 domain-containing protein [Paenibacillus paeoniae]